MPMHLHAVLRAALWQAALPRATHQELAPLLPAGQLVLNGHQLARVPPSEAQVAHSQHGGADGQRPAAVATPVIRSRLVSVLLLLHSRLVSVLLLLHSRLVSVLLLLHSRLVSVLLLLHSRLVSVLLLLHSRLVSVLVLLHSAGAAPQLKQSTAWHSATRLYSSWVAPDWQPSHQTTNVKPHCQAPQQPQTHAKQHRYADHGCMHTATSHHTATTVAHMQASLSTTAITAATTAAGTQPRQHQPPTWPGCHSLPSTPAG
jgi:hypothetical protein